MIHLRIGRYKLPSDCQVSMEDGYLIITSEVKQQRCRFCKYFGTGFSRASSKTKTTVCLRRPKVFKDGTPPPFKTYYKANVYHKACKFFEPKTNNNETDRQ